MESTIMNWMCKAIHASKEYDAIVSACGGNAALEDLLNTILPLLTRTMTKKSKELSYVFSLLDTEYVSLHESAKASRDNDWKGRARDFRGQFFRVTATDSGLLRGWSPKAQTLTYVIPHSLQKVMYEWLKQFYNKCDDSTKANFRKHDESLKRDYSATKGQRAYERGSHDIAHRRGNTGRRNKFVPVPKVH
jgi:hypothetical protein